MDLRIDARFVALELDERRFRLGVTGAVFAPIGNTYAFAGDRGVSSSFGLGAEYDFKDFFVTLNTGVADPAARAAPRARRRQRAHVRRRRLRPAARRQAPRRGRDLRLVRPPQGDRGRARCLAHRVAAQQQDVLHQGQGALRRRRRRHLHERRLRARFPGVAVVGGSFGIADSDARSPGFNYVITAEKDTDGDGYPDVIDLCPEDPEDGKQPKPSDGCPDMPDRDGDGIPDVVDKCPDDPEDKDGIDDRDGCPEEDADQDGIPDATDKCPKEPGQVVVEDPEKNGCPFYIRRITGSAEIEIMKQVEFEFDSSRILPQSYPILDEVVRLLKANPEIKLLSIEGHTDNQGTIDYNDRLAQQPRHRGQGLPDQQGRSVGAAHLRRLWPPPAAPVQRHAGGPAAQPARRVPYQVADDRGPVSSSRSGWPILPPNQATLCVHVPRHVHANGVIFPDAPQPLSRVGARAPRLRAARPPRAGALPGIGRSGRSRSREGAGATMVALAGDRKAADRLFRQANLLRGTLLRIEDAGSQGREQKSGLASGASVAAVAVDIDGDRVA